MSGISSKAAGTLENKKKYNGIEFDEDLGLNIYEAFYRHLDPQTGRWWEIDPKIEHDQESLSPYNSMANDPILKSDPLGDIADDGDGGGDWGTRIWGSVKAVGGLVEMGVGAVGGAVTSWTGVGAVVGGAAVVHGADVTVSGFKQMWNGTQSQTLTEQGISAGLQAAGVSPQTSNTVAGYTDGVISIALTGGASSVASGTKTATATNVVTDAQVATSKSSNPITGYTRHGINQTIGRDGGRGVSASATLDAVTNPTKVIAQAGGKTKYVGQNAQVVLNSEGKVITNIGKSRGPQITVTGKGNAALNRAKSMGLEYDPKKIH